MPLQQLPAGTRPAGRLFYCFLLPPPTTHSLSLIQEKHNPCLVKILQDYLSSALLSCPVLSCPVLPDFSGGRTAPNPKSFFSNGLINEKKKSYYFKIFQIYNGRVKRPTLENGGSLHKGGLLVCTGSLVLTLLRSLAKQALKIPVIV